MEQMTEPLKILISQADYLFTKRLSLLSLWQEIADQFYPERANFTVQKNIGNEYADYLTTSYPIMCRQELGNTFSSMLRPTNLDWFHMKPGREDQETTESLAWLEWAGKLMKRAMYDKQANFVRATKEGDQDFAAFGQAVISVELNRNYNALLYRCHHLRDVVWSENYACQIDTIFHRYKEPAIEIVQRFPKTVSDEVRRIALKEPWTEVDCMRIIVPASRYEMGPNPKKIPFVSIYVEKGTNKVLEQTRSWTKVYCIPRWQTVSGSQFAYSPATIAALPDARLIQAQSLVLLEAGEKATNPPLIIQDGVVRGDVGFYAGGMTFVDDTYDEKTGESIRPMALDFSGIGHGINLRQDVKEALAQAFFLNKIQLPQMTKEMTAFEVGQRVQEYIRQALPLFEPMEIDYNGDLCEMSFETLMRANSFGDPGNMPRELRGATAIFKFASPLHDAEEKQKASIFMQTRGILAEAAAVDQGSVNMVDIRKSLRDTLQGMGTPAKWLRSDSAMQKMDRDMAQHQQADALIQQMGAGADVAQKVGDAGQSLQRVGSESPNMRA